MLIWSTYVKAPSKYQDAEMVNVEDHPGGWNSFRCPSDGCFERHTGS